MRPASNWRARQLTLRLSLVGRCRCGRERVNSAPATCATPLCALESHTYDAESASVVRCQMTRRTFMPAVALAAAQTTAASPRARIESIAIISQQPEFYHGWPTLFRRRNGELLVAYSGGRE